MRRALPFAGLATALVLGVVGGGLLARAPEASPPATAGELAPAPRPPAQLELPDDRPIRGVAIPEPSAPALQDGVRIQIPRLRIDLPLLPGDVARDVDAEQTPTTGAFLLPGSAVPGATGNAYVYAHARPGLFLPLWNVRLGDLIEIVEPSGGVLRFTATEIHPRVPPTDLRYMTPTDDERLTLQTSTGPTGSDPRFVVVAKPAP